MEQKPSATVGVEQKPSATVGARLRAGAAAPEAELLKAAGASKDSNEKKLLFQPNSSAASINFKLPSAGP